MEIRHCLTASKNARYLQNAMWIVDNMYAIRSVKPKETYTHYFADLFNNILPPQDAKAYNGYPSSNRD